MPAYLEESDVVAVKVVNCHPENRKYGLPTVMATITLIDPRTGAPEAIMGGTWITALRTGAAGALAAKYLANPSPKTVGFVGAGIQARTQLIGLQTVFRTIEEAKLSGLPIDIDDTYACSNQGSFALVDNFGPDKGGKVQVTPQGKLF